MPTARTLAVASAPCVVKHDGLAAGKGVFVCRTDNELQAALSEVEALGGTFLIEELLDGDELSVFAICDGTRAVAFGAARDYKRADDGDRGPNTGGMGSYSPVADLPAGASTNSCGQSTHPSSPSSRPAAHRSRDCSSRD